MAADCRLVNLALVVVKAVAGVISHSSSLLADAAHSAADILSDILTLSTITFSLREPNERYPLGYGKVETLGAIGVSSLLCTQSPPPPKLRVLFGEERLIASVGGYWDWIVEFGCVDGDVASGDVTSVIGGIASSGS